MSDTKIDIGFIQKTSAYCIEHNRTITLTAFNLKKLLFCIILTLTSCAQPPVYRFSHAAPETKGYSSERLADLQAHLEESGSSAMIIMVDGEISYLNGVKPIENT